MDPATLIGVIGALVFIIVANVMEGGNPMSLLLIPPILLVVGGTIMITLAGGTLADGKAAVQGMVKAFTGKAPDAAAAVPTLVALSDKARREGLLALEDALGDIDDPFLTKGLTLAIDGTDPDEVRDILEAQIQATKSRTKQAAKFFNSAGAYAPTIGIVGTVMGLVHVLENLAEPEKLGHLIAGAFVATLWGVMSANVFFLPVGARINRLGELEIIRMEVVVEGVAGLQAGSNPRVVAQRLQSLLPDDEREPEAA
ncbi:MotA/TolQ/ExbB proton channel family protein [Nocardioides sp. YIM 152315]|uniref:motility protein A n=1 Tax=Nocardioides sp. YIM 152315 TaxID=3031760 RepID=UPI0023DAB713|nr:MotA/TolQ/ExbB proton channel family protein [Nocardioides sp. YIM 152315]MDF1605972.1 MotA/TolQ/ExbB proton channel family protein [Nocardioides sp. YIM 152315]